MQPTREVAFVAVFRAASGRRFAFSLERRAEVLVHLRFDPDDRDAAVSVVAGLEEEIVVPWAAIRVEGRPRFNDCLLEPEALERRELEERVDLGRQSVRLRPRPRRLVGAV